MATYEKYKHDIVRHEGNLADIVVDLEGIEEIGGITIQVRKNDARKTLIFEKSTLDSETSGDIIVNSEGTGFTIVLNPEDTKGYPGNHLYEIDILNNDHKPFLTIGGIFRIEPEINSM